MIALGKVDHDIRAAQLLFSCEAGQDEPYTRAFLRGNFPSHRMLCREILVLRSTTPLVCISGCVASYPRATHSLRTHALKVQDHARICSRSPSILICNFIASFKLQNFPAAVPNCKIKKVKYHIVGALPQLLAKKYSLINSRSWPRAD